MQQEFLVLRITSTALLQARIAALLVKRAQEP